MLTILVAITSAERTFLKLKLIKSYLRLTMLQERSIELAILFITKNIVVKLEYENLVNNFEPQNVARKVNWISYIVYYKKYSSKIRIWKFG